MFSGKPASSRPGRLEEEPLVAMETVIHIVFTPCSGVPGSSVLYLQGLYHCALGAAVISTDYWEPAPLLNPEGIILEGPLIGWTSPQGTAPSPYLGWSLDGHPSTVRKLFLAESCFELFVIIFLAIADPDKYWPGHRNVWVRRQIREFGVAFERECVEFLWDGHTSWHRRL